MTFVRVPVFKLNSRGEVHFDAQVVNEPHAPATLDVLQREVGGFIELAEQHESKIRPGYTLDAWCNENGVALELPLNRYFPRVGRVRGSIVVSVGDEETGETVRDVSPDLVEEILAWVRTWPIAITGAL